MFIKKEMKVLDEKQRAFLEWVVETQDNRMNCTISEIILEEGVYGDKLQVLLNELVNIYRSEYIKHLKV